MHQDRMKDESACFVSLSVYIESEGATYITAGLLAEKARCRQVSAEVSILSDKYRALHM